MVRATIHYVTNPPGPGEPMLTYVTEDEARSTMCVEPGVDVEISDVRGANPTLRREGFQLVDHTSAVPDLEALEGDADLDRVYGREMRSLLRDVTGAEAVYLLGGPKRRYGEFGDRQVGASVQRQARTLRARRCDRDLSASTGHRARVDGAPAPPPRVRPVGPLQHVAAHHATTARSSTRGV
jgi:hypothetical protein